MFTGIIQTTARLKGRTPSGGGARLILATPRALPALAIGESIAVNGACLTVTGRRGRAFTVDVSPETLRRTTLGRLARGSRVNLERALRVGDRMGGHIVQGHVDGVGRLEAIRPDGNWTRYSFQAPRSLSPYLVEKGSIAVDGVSLTVAGCRGRCFTIALIPHTLAATTLGDRRPGDPVNLEADVLLKQIVAMLRVRPTAASRAPSPRQGAAAASRRGRRRR